MREIDPKDLDRRSAYFYMTTSVVPRPIGWASTVSEAGAVNVAPFSFFNACCADPPMVMLTVGRRRGERKDTSNNLLATKEAVVHIPTRPVAEAMVQTSAGLPAGESEMDFAKLTAVESKIVKPPRIAEAAVAMEAKLERHLEIGNGTDMFLLEVVYFHLDEAVLGEDGYPDPAKLAAVGRLGGIRYCETTDVFEIPGPPR